MREKITKHKAGRGTRHRKSRRKEATETARENTTRKEEYQREDNAREKPEKAQTQDPAQEAESLTAWLTTRKGKRKRTHERAEEAGRKGKKKTRNRPIMYE